MHDVTVRIDGMPRHPDWRRSKQETDRLIVGGMNRILAKHANVQYRLWRTGDSTPGHHIRFTTVYLGVNERGKHEHAAGFGWYDSNRIQLHDGWIRAGTGNMKPEGYWHGSYWYTRSNGEKLLERAAAHEAGHNYGQRHVGGNCLMNINLNSDNVCSGLLRTLIARFGKREEFEPPVGVGQKLERINFPETGRGSALLKDGSRVHFNGMSVQLVGDIKVVKIGPSVTKSTASLPKPRDVLPIVLEQQAVVSEPLLVVEP